MKKRKIMIDGKEYDIDFVKTAINKQTAKQIESKDGITYCPTCGEIDFRENYCGRCGQKLEGA